MPRSRLPGSWVASSSSRTIDAPREVSAVGADGAGALGDHVGDGGGRDAEVVGEVEVPVRRASAGEHGSLNLAAAAVVPRRLARQAARLPGLDHHRVDVEHGGEEGPSRHRPVALDPGASQLGVRGSGGLQLASILGSVEVRVVGEQRGAVDEPALGLRLDVRRPGAAPRGRDGGRASRGRGRRGWLR